MKLKWNYWKLTLKDAIVGIFVGNVPIFVVLFFLGLMTTGKAFGDPIHRCDKNDSECWRSMFDSFTLPDQGITDRSSTEFTGIRNGRTGLAFITVGYCVMFMSSKAFVKKKKIVKDLEEEAYDGNLWLTGLWTRTSFLLISTFYTLFILCAI